MPFPDLVEWTSSYPNSQDDLGADQPDLVNGTAPSTWTGDLSRVSQIHTLRDKLDAVARKVGDENSLPVNSLSDRVDDLEAATGSYSASPLTTKGDVYVYSTGSERLPVGTNGQILSADSTEDTGLKWIDNSGGGGNTLDEAYDQGGAGAGRIINATNGAVQINGSSGNAFYINQDLGGNSGNGAVIAISSSTPLDSQEVAGIALSISPDNSDQFGAAYIGLSMNIADGGSASKNGVFVVGTELTSAFYAQSGKVQLLDGHVQLKELASAPGNNSTYGNIYTKAASGNTELFYEDEAGNEVQITNAGSVNAGAGSSPLTTKGDVYVYSTGSERLPIGTNGQVLSVDTSEDTGLKWIDNSGNGSGSSAPTTVDSFPTASTSYNDEFEGTGSGDLDAKWTWYNEPTGADEYWGIDKGSLYFCVDDTGAGDQSKYRLLLQDVPASDYVVEAKINLYDYNLVNFVQCGLMITDSNPATGDNNYRFIYFYNNTLQFLALPRTGGVDGTVLSGNLFTNKTFYSYILRIEYTASSKTFVCKWSRDGLHYIIPNIWTAGQTVSWTPAKFGIYAWGNGGNALIKSSVEWFRVTE
jgi:hypothetical protein